MTDCTAEPLLFSRLKRQNVRADFRSGRLTCDGGGVLLRQVDRSLGLIDAINACIPDPRNPFFTVHTQRTLLAQRIFGIALGYEDLNDHQDLREDFLFQLVCERGIEKDLPLASPSPLCRLESRVDCAALGQIAKVFVETFIRSHCTPPALYDDLYCQHGDAENRIKEQQLGLFADRSSCHDFVANQFRVLLSAAAYILRETLRPR